MESLFYTLASLVLIFTFIIPGDRDNSDMPKGPRSGLKIMTDELTGVQYVSNGHFGGITTRVDRDGNIIISQDWTKRHSFKGKE